MSVVLSELVSPSHTAVLTMEVQRAVIGDLVLWDNIAVQHGRPPPPRHAPCLLYTSRCV